MSATHHSNSHLVFLTADYDCDGVSTAAHRVSVPAHRAVELADPEALAAFMAPDAPYANYVRDAYRVMPEADFRAEFFPTLSAWSRDYWNHEGYTGLGTAWAPWAHDDSIGIPALDYTYDDFEV